MVELNAYYDRSEAEEEKGYVRHLFRAGHVLQSAEMNEIQQSSLARMRRMGDALFKEGDIVRDARAISDPETGIVQLESGAIYLSGQVRGVPAAVITIPTTGTVAIGIYLPQRVITEEEDPSLLDPASETRSYNEPGAGRLQVIPRWGILGEDISNSSFFPIYYADEGEIRAKEAPPQLDSVSQAIARYDRDSTGSSYIVSGMLVTQMPDNEAGEQVYSVKDGRARVNGFGISLNTSRRLTYPTTPDLRYIDSEPHASTTNGNQRVNLDRTPISNITQVRITKETTETIIHGSFGGSMDPLPHTSVIDIISVTQGATTFIKGVDFQFTAGKVDWTLPGNEPAPGSSYQVTYWFITSVTPTDVDDTGFTVSAAVVGTLILVTYYAKLPRIDRLCIDETGQFLWLVGVATDYDPVRPSVQSNLLTICQIVQTWTSDRRIINDGVRMVPMADLEAVTNRLDILTDLVAQQKLVSDAGTRESAAKKGMFVDPFIDDNQRDQGISQTAAVLGYGLTLPIDGDAFGMSLDITESVSCDFTLEPVLTQTSRTGDMKINPWLAFGIAAKPVTLTPAVDRWTVTQTTWLSAITQKFIIDNSIKDSYHRRLYGNDLAGWPSYTDSNSTNVLVSTNTRRIENLRQIDVAFQATGFGPGEQLTSVKFDGITVTPIGI